MNNLIKITKCMKLDSISADKRRCGETRQYNTIVGMWILATEVYLSCLHSQSHRLNIEHTDEVTNY